MKKLFWLLFAAVFSMPALANSLEVNSIEPSRAAPGTLVSVVGNNFPKDILVSLGNVNLKPRIIQKNNIKFTVPNLVVGSYVLTIEDLKSESSISYSFEILAPAPLISTITPRSLDACNLDPEYQVSIYGRNFTPESTLLLDEKVVSSQFLNSNHIEAELPNNLSPGIFGVVVRNPDGATSLPYSVTVNNKPEIYDVERGDELVNSYEIIIHGKNFEFNSILVVNEPEDNSIGLPFQQLTIFARVGSEKDYNISKVTYKDCQTLIYRRYPASFQNREIGLQIFNPDGERTELYYVNLP